jgi:methyl-accepting chemotaxis protein
MEDLSDDELKEMIEDVIAQMIKDGELQAGSEFEGEEEGEEMEMGDEEEEVDLAELLREIEEMKEENEYSTNEIFDPSAPIVLAAGLGTLGGLIALGTAYFYSKGAAKEEELKRRITNLILSKQKGTLDKEWETMKKDMESNPQLKQKVLDNLNTIQKLGLSLDEAETTSNPMLAALKNVAADQDISIGNIVKASEKVEDEVEKVKKSVEETEETMDEMKAELDEALSTIETLKAELNEINLLNAKLLYSNKIFKAKNLNENQKVKVLSSFDKAKNVGEVKMVYETLNEGIKVKKETIKENLGRASKATTTPTAKQPIVESNDVFKRMQKLAGII